MQPDIKCRAWDTVEKHFVYFELWTGVNKHTPPIYSHAHTLPWELYTGVKDINGKDIFVGDIIEGSWENDFGSFTPSKKEVFFCKNKLSFECKNIDEDPDITDIHWAIGIKATVIGNIHDQK